MVDFERHKPSHEEWLSWSQIIVDRLNAAAHVYASPPTQDHIMKDIERQSGNAWVVDQLRRYHKLLDGTQTPTGSLAEVAHHDERVIDGLAILVRETLNHLPSLSLDMQKLLNCSWEQPYRLPLAEEVFAGQMDMEQDGIGSGNPENGRLPYVLKLLLRREQMDGRRVPREALVRAGNPRPNADVRRRWADVNSRHLRSAGRIE